MKLCTTACVLAAGLATSAFGQFQNTYGTAVDERSESIRQTSDGGYIMVGHQSFNGNMDMVAVKLDALGAVQWNFRYGGTGRDMANRVEEVSTALGGGYIVAGETNSGPANFGACMVRLGAAGNVLWARTYQGTPFVGGDAGPTGLCVTSNGNFVIANRIQLPGLVDQGMVLTRTSNAGAVVFSRVYADSRFGSRTWASLTDVEELAGGSLAVTGYTSSQNNGDYDTMWGRCDGAGNFVWSRTYGVVNAQDFGTNLIPNIQNTLMVTGRRAIPGTPVDSFIYRSDLAGNPAWYRGYDNFLANNAIEVVNTTGDVVVGGTTSNLPNNGAAMLRVGFGGGFQWCQEYGGPGTDIGESVDVITTGLALGGWTNSWGAGGFDFYFVNTDPAGNSRERCERRIDLPQETIPPPLREFQMPPVDRPESVALQWQPVPAGMRRVDACPTPCVPPPLNMTAWFPFDEPVGNRANDIVANNDGFWSGRPIASPAVVGNGLCLDGIDDLVRVPDNNTIDLGTGDLTIDAWVRTTSTNGVQIIADKRVNNPRVVGYSLFLSNGQLGFQLADGSGPNSTCACNIAAACTNWGSGVAGFVADGNWHLVAVTVRRSSVTGGTFYVDGVPVGTFDPTCRTGNVDNTSPLIIGRRSFSNTGYFNGCIDELEIFKRALTAAEVAGIYNAGPAGKCKDTCLTPWDVPFCRGAAAVTPSMTICNNNVTPQSYLATFNGLPTGPGCSINGPTAFTPGISFPVTIPANTCQSFPVTIGRPAGMNAAFQVGCYEMVVTNILTGETSVCHGSVQDRRDLCAVIRPGGFDSPLRLPFGTQQQALLELTFNERIVTPVRIRAVGPDMQPDLTNLSINDLPPGQDSIRVVTGNAGQIIAILIGLFATEEEYLSFYTLVVETDSDGDGTWEVLTSQDIDIVPVPPCIGDYNRDGGVDGDDVISFFEDWDNQIDSADVNEDGGVDGDDVITFFEAWDGGC